MNTNYGSGRGAQKLQTFKQHKGKLTLEAGACERIQKVLTPVWKYMLGKSTEM
jgi:hypothetical protein